MTINRTTLLDLPLPVTGTESGTWGDTTNNGLTQYMDIAIAGALSITTDVTLATTEGDASGTGIVSTTAQYRTLIVPASGPSANIVITAPSSNRTYHVINRNATYTVQVRAGANSGVTLGVNQSATVGYDSVAGDYVLVGPIGPTVPVSSGGTGATTLTANNVILGNGTSAVQFVAPGATGNVLTSNGTTWTSTAGTSLATPLAVIGNAIAGAEIRLPEDTDNGSNYVAIKAPDNIASNATLTAPAVTDTLATIGTAQTFTAAQTFRAANAIRSEAASTQDAVVIAGRAGGTSSYAVTLTPAELAASRTLTLPEPGENVTLGYLNIPQNSQSAAYTLVLADAGKHIFHPSSDNNARTFTIPANSSVPYPIGTAITFINMAAANVTIAITSDTMYLSSAGTTGSRTLAQYGSATAVKITSTSWIISGSGLT